MLTAPVRQAEPAGDIAAAFAAGARLFRDRDPTIDEMLRAGFTAREVAAHLERLAEPAEANS